jgi:hypothetical protein
MNLYNVVDITGSIALGGASVQPQLTTPGQRALYTMAGTAGQAVTIHFTGNTASTVWTLKRPSGSNQVSRSLSNNTYNINAGTLTETGRHTSELGYQRTHLTRQAGLEGSLRVCRVAFAEHDAVSASAKASARPRQSAKRDGGSLPRPRAAARLRGG